MGANVFFASASELATLTNTFSVDDVPTDPTTISLVITDPENTSTTYTFADTEITRTSAGVYTKDITCSIAGTWTYRWVGTGDVVKTEAGTWDVLDVTLGRLYATVSALKSRLGIGVDAPDTRDDFELHTVCFAASRMVEHYTQRIFWRTVPATVRTLVPTSPYCLRLGPFGDLVSVSALATDPSGGGTFGTAWATGDYQLWPVNPSAAPETRPYTQIRAIGGRTFPQPYAASGRADRVQVTGVWGWPAVPYSVRQSALITAAELFRSKSTFEAQAGYDEMAQFVLRRNPFALDLIKPYRLTPVLMA
jgi:hypothetical protein